MNNIRLASSPWGFRETSLEAQCAWLAQQGFEYICGQFAEFPGSFPPDSTPEELSAALKLAESHNLRYASVNANGDFMVRENLDKEIAVACRDIDNAARLQPEVIIVFAGWADRDDQAVYDQVSSALKTVAQHAAGHGLTVALENHGGLTRAVEQCNRILAAVQEPNIGLNYDPANFAMYGEDPRKALEHLDHPIVFTHFKSLRTVDGKKQYCRLREGQIDYLPILRRLQNRYNGVYALEYEEPADVFEGTLDDLHCLREWMKQL